MTNKHNKLLPRFTRRKELSPEEKSEMLRKKAELYYGKFIRSARKANLIEADTRHDQATRDLLGRQATVLAKTGGDVSDRRAFANEVDPTLQEEVELLQYQSTHDPMTGALNRDGLEKFLDISPSPQALLLVDAANFKAINDTYGYARGDDVIRSTHTMLQETLREGDVIVRLGGDEFLVVLGGASSTEAHDNDSRKTESEPETLINDVSARIAEVVNVFLDQHDDCRAVGFNLSVGGVVWSGDTDFTTLLETAEKGMKAHKASQHDDPDSVGRYR